MSDQIKFGTDGWRAIIAKEYTVENVARVSEASAVWLNNQNIEEKNIVIGHDCRFGENFLWKQQQRFFYLRGSKYLWLEVLFQLLWFHWVPKI